MTPNTFSLLGVPAEVGRVFDQVDVGRARDDVAVMSHGVLMVSGGIVLGLASALGMARLMASVLYGVSPADPLTYLAVVALLAATGLVACSVPAWRASTAQPVTALRSE